MKGPLEKEETGRSSTSAAAGSSRGSRERWLETEEKLVCVGRVRIRREKGKRNCVREDSSAGVCRWSKQIPNAARCRGVYLWAATRFCLLGSMCNIEPECHR